MSYGMSLGAAEGFQRPVVVLSGIPRNSFSAHSEGGWKLYSLHLPLRNPRVKMIQLAIEGRAA